MYKRYYIKRDGRRIRKVIRFFSLGISLTGVLFGAYFFFPLISWKLYLEPAFASQNFETPIPRTTIITKDYIQSLWLNTTKSIQDLYDPKARNWMPSTPFGKAQIATQISYYFISIPKINITSAVVSTVDTDLASHLVNFPGTGVPPAVGNAVIFGHSTLPQLFDPKNYRTILANAHTLAVHDTIVINVSNINYTYKIFNISILDADDTSYLSQEGQDSYLTLVTCTPPGTVWKRLIIRAKLDPPKLTSSLFQYYSYTA